MRTITGHVGIDDLYKEFEFEVEDSASMEDIECELEKAMWESGLVDLYFSEEAVEQ